MHEVETLIVGFGFSAIPLVRELDASGSDYKIISRLGGSVWRKLSDEGRLDFDLVSSNLSSYYSFDLVHGSGKDYYPLAREFYGTHIDYETERKDKIIDDVVSRMENYDTYSMVYTESGATYRAANVVFATGFQRKIHTDLATLDWDHIKNKTIVFDTMGDSANLLIARLVPGDNKIICLHNGFMVLDKVAKLEDVLVPLDQLEVHNLARLFPRTYRTFAAGTNRPFELKIENPLLGALQAQTQRLVRLVTGIIAPTEFYCKYPEAVRWYRQDNLHMNAAWPNGVIAIKCWSIDVYEELFADELEASIAQGYLLNDLALFIDQGLVEITHRDSAVIDHENHTVTRKAQCDKFDYYIKGDRETPRLPPIARKGETGDIEYSYLYRDNYLGVVSPHLSNVYFLGYTRPTTGGLANISEIQSLLIHRLITDPVYRRELGARLEPTIKAYNRKYYPSTRSTPVDHLVLYGLYTEDVAREVGVNLRLRDCRSLKDLGKLLFLPNNTYKYRQRGRYQVPGCEELVERVYTKYRIVYSTACWAGALYLGYHLLYAASAVALYLNHHIGLPILLLLFLIQIVLRRAFIGWMMNTPYLKSKAFFVYAAACLVLWDVRLVYLFWPLDMLVTFAIRQSKKSRYAFNDLKCRRRFTGFLDRYLAAYKRVRSRASAG